MSSNFDVLDHDNLYKRLLPTWRDLLSATAKYHEAMNPPYKFGEPIRSQRYDNMLRCRERWEDKLREIDAWWEYGGRAGLGDKELFIDDGSDQFILVENITMCLVKGIMLFTK